jgi:hypothetical protein
VSDNAQDYGGDPTVIVELLRQFGWGTTTGPSIGRPYAVWRNERAHLQDVLVPLDPTKDDYDDLLERAFRALTLEYGSEVERIASFLTFQRNSSLEATRWLKESPVGEGLITWGLGESVFEVARKCLSAAAKAAKEPRRYYGGASDYIAKRFLDETFMGQTEVGSFIVTAYTPSNQQFFYSKSGEESAASKLVTVESRSGGEIIHKLEAVVAGVREKLDDFKKTPRDEIFDELVPIGLSYELSDALATLSNNGDGAVRFSRPAPNDPPREYVIQSVESPVLARVANRLAITREPQAFNLVGEVTLLDHVSTEQVHTVRLHVSNNPSVRTVRVRLTPDEYKVAIDAHKEDIPLRISGLVEKEGRYNWIYSPTSVAIAADASNDDDEVVESSASVEEPPPSLF